MRTKKSNYNFCKRWTAFVFAMALMVTLSAQVGMSLAGFTDNQSNGISPIRSATFDATVSVEGVSANEDGIFTLTTGNSYAVTLRAVEGTTAKNGYFLISTNELEAYTNSIVGVEGGYTFTIDLRQDAPGEGDDPVELENGSSTKIEIEKTTIDFVFTPCWGTYAAPTTFGFSGPVCLENGANVNAYGEEVDPDRPVLKAYEALVEHDIPLYFQNDYTDNRYGAGTIASDGCGVVSLTMIANYMTGHEYSITDLARWFGGRAENNIQRFEIGATTLGLSWEKAENIDKAIEALYGGKIVVMMMDGFESSNPFTTSQHFIVVRGVTTEGRFLVNDSNKPNYDKWELKTGFEIGFTRETLVAGYSGAWIFDPEAIPEDYVPYVKDEPVRTENYPGVELTYEEQLLIAKVIWVEAQGECAEGQQAVAEVILNRLTADGRFGDTVSEVIYAEGQFRSVPKIPDATPWQAQYDALEAALYGEPILEKDVYYFATEPMTDNVFISIGGHIFCKDGQEILPETTEPEETEPGTTEPEETEPETTEPEETEPETTEPEETEPETTEPVETVPETTEPQETVSPSETQSTEEQPHEVPSFYQADYTEIPWGEVTIGEDGSDIVALAMVSNYLTGYNYTPDMLADWFGENGENDITRLDAAISALMLPAEKAEAAPETESSETTKTMDEAFAAVAEGNILILRLESTGETSSIFTDGIHFLVIRGITEDGKFLVNDPCKTNCEKEELVEGFENGFSLEDLLPGSTHAWIFDLDALNNDLGIYTQ